MTQSPLQPSPSSHEWVRYAFPAPGITEAVLSGAQSARITAESLREPIPLDWSEQRLSFGLTDR